MGNDAIKKFVDELEYRLNWTEIKLPKYLFNEIVEYYKTKYTIDELNNYFK